MNHCEGTVLIVEDDDVYAQRIIAPHFQRWRVEHAYNLPQAQVAATELERVVAAVVDLELPGAATTFDVDRDDGHGLDVVRIVRQRFPAASIMVLTAHLSPLLVNAAHELEARYVVKGDCKRNLAKMSRDLTRLVDRVEILEGEVVARVAEDAKLSPRETEILALSVADTTREDMADELGISRWTLKTQVRNILRKTGAKRLDDLVREVRSQLRAAPAGASSEEDG